MTTLIAVYNKSGCVGRCDAKCYDAKHPTCDCICGGRNHSVGLDQAAENTREMYEPWLEEYKREKGLTDTRDFVNHQFLGQTQLFDLSNFTRAVKR